MGKITHKLLETIGIPWLPFPESEENIMAAISEAEASMRARLQPFALVMSQGTLAECELKEQERLAAIPCERQRHGQVAPAERMRRTEALEAILEALNGDEAILGTTGKTGRELWTIADRANHLYVVGGMGAASAIGFGVAQALPRQPVVILDGDGAALMKLGNFSTIGYYQPGNLLHIVLDNEAHDSTGGQRTVSSTVDFAAIAAATHYRSAVSADRREDVMASVKFLRHQPGPSLLHVKIKPGSPEKLGRPTMKPHEVKERFMAFLKAQNGSA